MTLRPDDTKPSALATSARSHVVAVTVADLDDVVAQARKLLRAGADAYWQTGQLLSRVEAERLYKLRTLPNGRAAYTSFRQWVEEEVKIRADRAYRMLGVAREYTVEDIRRLDSSKLELAVRVPSEARGKLLERIAGGASYRDVKKLVRETTKSTDEQPSTKPSKRTDAATKARVKKRAEQARAATTTTESSAPKKDRVTIVAVEGTRTFPLYRKPKSMKDIEASKQRRANGDDALPFYGRLELTNEVTMALAVVVDAEGNVVARVAFTRDEA